MSIGVVAVEVEFHALDGDTVAVATIPSSSMRPATGANDVKGVNHAVEHEPAGPCRRPRAASPGHAPTAIDGTPEDACTRVRQEIERRLREPDQWAPATLLPPSAFSDEPATDWDFERLEDPNARIGRHADAVHFRLMSSCAGWKTRPTASEFYDAVRATRPTARQRAIVSAWGREATFFELLEAWAQRAYTDRELVRALHLAGFDCGERIREINRWAKYSR